MKLFTVIIYLVLLFTFSVLAQQPVFNAKGIEKISSLDQQVNGKVVGVHDGDTCTVLDKDKRQYKFRLKGIDAPELNQEFGAESKKRLSDMIFGKEVIVVFSKVDKYNRYVGNIYINGLDINLEQIKAGMAWHFKEYASEQSDKDRTSYSAAELKAKAEKKGLWQQINPGSPSHYRAESKNAQMLEKISRKYLVGPRGGCYYTNSNGNKTYVDRKFCN